MTDDTHLTSLLRAAVPPIGAGAAPMRDLWPLVAERSQAGPAWSWLDAGLAAGAAIVLLLRPDWLVLLAYYL